MRKTIRKIHKLLLKIGSISEMDEMILISSCIYAIQRKIYSADFSHAYSIGEYLYEEMVRDIDDEILEEKLKILRNDRLNCCYDGEAATPLAAMLEWISGEEYKRETVIQDIYNYVMSLSGMRSRSGIYLTPEELLQACYFIMNPGESDIVGDFMAGAASFFTVNPIGNGTGIEYDSDMYVLGCLNLLLNEKKGIRFACADFLTDSEIPVMDCVFANPPYAQESKTEIDYILKAAEHTKKGGKIIALIPQAVLVNTFTPNRNMRNRLLTHTLQYVITLNDSFFRDADVSVCIVVILANQPQNNKKCTFIDCSDVLPGQSERIITRYEASMRGIGERTVSVRLQKEDDWIYNFYSGNGIIPPNDYFVEYIKDYMLFRLRACMDGKQYLYTPFSDFSAGRPGGTGGQEWKERNLSELFEIKGAKRTPFEKQGRYPFISCRSTNNGVDGYCADCTDNESNEVILVCESAMCGFTTVQEYAFASSGHIEKLLPRFDMSLECGLFMGALLTYYHRDKYSFTFKASKRRLKMESVRIPVLQDGTPDFEYMEKYVSDIIRSMKEDMKKYLS